MRFFLAILAFTIHASLLHAVEPSFKVTIGGNFGDIPLEINKMSKNIKPVGGIKINSWTLSPNFLSFAGDKNTSSFMGRKETKDNLYIKIKFKF